MEIVLILNNIRATGNVGSILRTADGFGVSKVVFSGYTPRINDERVLPHLRKKLNKQISKTALGAEEYVESCVCDDIKTELEKLRAEGYKIVGLENNLEDERLIVLRKENFIKISERLGKKIVLILGEEVEGIDPELYGLVDVFLEIPMQGRKESFNVSVATGICLFGLRNLD